MQKAQLMLVIHNSISGNSGVVRPVQVNKSVLLRWCNSAADEVGGRGMLPSFKILKISDASKRRDRSLLYMISTTRGLVMCPTCWASQRRTFKKCNVRIHSRPLTADSKLVIPARKVVRLLITSADVIHSLLHCPSKLKRTHSW
ncbi:MAG: hypothetical protein ACKERG_01095 [Candidatus Hodgkinia cicadicola]